MTQSLIDLALLLVGLAFMYWAGYRHAQRGSVWLKDPCASCECGKDLPNA